MPSPVTSLTLTPNLRISLLTLILLPVLIWLGVWQLERADEKQELLQQHLLGLEQGAVELNRSDVLNTVDTIQASQAINARGFFNSKTYWLLDNKTYQGRVGYEVLMPFHVISPDDLENIDNIDNASKKNEQSTKDSLKDSVTIIVNRGWIAGDPARRKLPTLIPLDQAINISGVTHLPTDNFLVNESEQNADERWPKVIVEVDLVRFSGQLGETLPPWTVRLNSESSGALTINWQLVNMSPEKHTGYAVQWFSMAFVLGIMFILSNSNLVNWIKYRFRSVKP